MLLKNAGGSCKKLAENAGFANHGPGRPSKLDLATSGWTG